MQVEIIKERKDIKLGQKKRRIYLGVYGGYPKSSGLAGGIKGRALKYLLYSI